MNFTVTYEDGVWLFELTTGDSRRSFTETFEYDDLDDAQAAASDLIAQIAEDDPDLDPDLIEDTRLSRGPWYNDE